MTAETLEDTLVHVRSMLIDLERHLDRGASERDLAEVGRAWVRAAQVERALRSLLPPEVTKNLPELEGPAADARADP